MDDFGLKGARYNSALPTLVNGEVTELQVDVNGRLLVQADVSVLVDFLGLNGASDNANILIVGTEDGTSSGTAHAVRLAADGAVAIQDNGGSITVDATDLDIRDLDFATDSVDVSGSSVTATVSATDLDIRDLAFATDKVDVTGSEVSLDAATLAALEDITVSATDLDIRDLSAAQDNVAISDGTDTLAINADGSINVNSTATVDGAEVYAVTDDQAADGDGEYAITSTFSNAFTPIAVAAGETLHIYGWQWCADKNAQARIVVIDDTDTMVIKNSLNSTAQPSVDSHFADAGRIEVAGGAAVSVVVQIKARQAGGTANASASLHARLVS